MTTPGLHPDLVRIRQLIADTDDLACRPETTGEDLHRGLVDFDSLFVAATERAAAAMHDIHPLQFLANPSAVFSATWADGFLAGVQFARRGGVE